jgi:hypothetical protein
MSLVSSSSSAAALADPTTRIDGSLLSSLCSLNLPSVEALQTSLTARHTGASAFREQFEEVERLRVKIFGVSEHDRDTSTCKTGCDWDYVPRQPVILRLMTDPEEPGSIVTIISDGSWRMEQMCCDPETCRYGGHSAPKAHFVRGGKWLSDSCFHTRTTWSARNSFVFKPFVEIWPCVVVGPHQVI